MCFNNIDVYFHDLKFYASIYVFYYETSIRKLCQQWVRLEKRYTWQCDVAHKSMCSSPKVDTCVRLAHLCRSVIRGTQRCKKGGTPIYV